MKIRWRLTARGVVTAMCLTFATPGADLYSDGTVTQSNLQFTERYVSTAMDTSVILRSVQVSYSF